MMHPAMPQATRLKQVGFLISFSRKDLSQCLTDRQRIVQDTKRIDITPEFIFHQQISNVFSKTRAKEHNSLGMADFRHTFRQLN
jgi:hypothetical protein